MSLINRARIQTTLPAIDGQIGRLRSFSTNIPFVDVASLIPYDPSDLRTLKSQVHRETYEYVQRALTKVRKMALIEFIDEISNGDRLGSLPAVTIGFHRPLLFKSNAEQDGCGHLIIEDNRRNPRTILDGLARISSIIQFSKRLDDPNLKDPSREILEEFLASSTLAATILSPRIEDSELTKEEMGQIFFDLNFRATPIPSQKAIKLDTNDIYIKMTYKLAEKCAAIRDNGGMDTNQAKISQSSTAIVSQQSLLKFVRGAFEGEEYSSSLKAQVKNPNLNEDNFEQYRIELSHFINSIAFTMADRFVENKTESIHLNPSGFKAIAHIFFENRIQNEKEMDEVNEIGRKIGEIDFSKSSPIFSDMYEDVLDKKTGRTVKRLASPGSRTTVQTFIKRIREQLNKPTEHRSNFIQTRLPQEEFA